MAAPMLSARLQRLSEIEGIRIYGPKPSAGLGRAALVAFNTEQVHASDLAFFLDQVPTTTQAQQALAP